jgi:tRNA(Arg) A34 adenosine deaminase TadA
MAESVHPPEPEGRLKDFWDKPVRDLVRLPVPLLAAGQIERHTIYSLLVMSLVAHYWNGNKRGNVGQYPWRAKQRASDGRYCGGDYLGHNIAAVAVDGRGAVIDFDFNHNDILNSSVEHAESRLIRRVFSLSQIYDDWETRGPSDPPRSASYSTILSEVTVYTSLESCSQCSGIMALGSVKEVVFLQRDPGQNSIGNILRNLSPVGGRYMPPRPLPANGCELQFFDTLGAGFRHFEEEVVNTPFHIAENGDRDHSPSITSFLCTDTALDIFCDGRKRFGSITLKHPDFQPLDSRGAVVATAFTNKQALDHAQRFFAYASTVARRGTPHTL